MYKQFGQFFTSEKQYFFGGSKSMHVIQQI